MFREKAIISQSSQTSAWNMEREKAWSYSGSYLETNMSQMAVRIILQMSIKARKSLRMMRDMDSRLSSGTLANFSHSTSINLKIKKNTVPKSVSNWKCHILNFAHSGECQRKKVSETNSVRNWKGKCQKLKVSETESVKNWKCQKLKVSKTESVRNWKCQKLKVSETESVRNWKCQKLKVSGTESVRNWKCQKLKVSGTEIAK